jgi:NADPH:quinone reductase-like Zn-dependent oxidoreductase
MKAIVRDEYGTPDVLELKEIDRPIPSEGEVLIKVHASSLNMADLDYLRGRPKVARLGSGLGRPKHRGLGLDMAGRVESIGEKVTRLKPGDEVWADLFSFGQNSFAEYVTGPERAFTLKPPGITFEQAATVPHSGVLALQGLRSKRPIQPGQKVLINGAGGCVGPFAIQIAKSLGAEVTGVDHTGKLELMRALGADHVVDYTIEDFAHNGQRYDLILDIAAQRSVLHYRRSLAPRGSYVLIARSLGGFFQGFLLGAMISLIGRKKIGVFMWVPNKKEDLDFLKGMLEDRKITPLIDSRFPLGEVPEALRHLESGNARGKVIITL